MTEKTKIIGVGDDGIEGLTQQALQTIRTAATLMGPQNLLDKVQTHLDGQSPPTTVALPADLDTLAAHIREALNSQTAKPIVILSSGDPLFYGTARYLCEKVGEEHFEVFPHVSSMQLAFARVKESWDEAYLTNLAAQKLPRVIDRIRSAEKVGIFTSDEVPPSALAAALLEQGIDYFNAYVCEDLGSKNERVTRGTLSQIANQQFSQLNVMILVRMPDVPDRPASLQGRRIFGNPDECFLQSQPKRGLLTQCEVRVIALAELDLGPTSIMWDVGAGSGSVAIEAAQLSPGGQVYGIEIDPEDYNLLIENARTFGVSNLTPVLGEAPSAWQPLPDPDAIFVGGTGRGVLGLVEEAWTRLKQGGRLVVQVASLNRVTDLESLIRKLGGDVQVLMINLARSQQQLDALRLEAVNPSFLITTRKLAGVDGVSTQQFYSALVATGCLIPFVALGGWVWPSDPATWFAFVMIGVAALVGHQLLTTAYRYAPASVLAPFSYVQIVFLTVSSWLVFNQPPDMWFFIGLPIVVGSGLYIWLRERQLSKSLTTATPIRD